MAPLEGIDISTLRAALHDRPDAKPTLRLVVAIAYLDGESVAALSDRYGVPESTIYAWFDRFNLRPSAAAATDDERPGRASELTATERERLKRALQTPPTEQGLDGDRWTARLVREFVAEQFDVDYSRVHAWRLLRTLEPRT
jgi:transposase